MKWSVMCARACARIFATTLWLVSVPACAAVPAQPVQLHAPGNPILADGSTYSADPAPLVADGKLYILAGRDTAPPERNDFVMPGWQLFVTGDPERGNWSHYRDFLRPHAVFAWAGKRHAYAAQIVQGPDRRYYLYAPVQ